MTMRRRTFMGSAALALLLARAGRVKAQSMQPPMPGGERAPMAMPPRLVSPTPPEGPFQVTAYGNFQRMVMAGDLGPRVVLGKVIQGGATDGVGALSGGRGEITITDGAPVITYGIETGRSPAAAEMATLLATGVARNWQGVAVARDVGNDEVEAYLAREAQSHGIDPNQSFPFRIRGTLTNYAMHVVAGPGAGQPPLTLLERRGDAISGLMVGVYAGPPLVGIATHPGTRTHTHWISDDRTSTAHLDSWGLRAGATLLLPRT